MNSQLSSTCLLTSSSAGKTWLTGAKNVCERKKKTFKAARVFTLQEAAGQTCWSCDCSIMASCFFYRSKYNLTIVNLRCGRTRCVQGPSESLDFLVLGFRGLKQDEYCTPAAAEPHELFGSLDQSERRLDGDTQGQSTCPQLLSFVHHNISAHFNSV